MATCTATKKQERLQNNYSSRSFSGKKGESQLRNDIVRFAQKHEGTKYKYAGKTPKGFDCSGFTYFVMKEFDIDLPSVSSAQENEGKKIAVKDAKPGDLLFFRRTKNGSVFHVGLVISNNSKGISMIHSSSSRGVVIDNLETNRYWKSKFATARNILVKH